jgi:sugar-phosphatase
VLDPTRDFAAVLFDLDGTLVDSTGAVERNWLRWAGEYDVDPVRLEGVHGIPARVVVASLVAADRHDEAYARIEHLEVSDTEGVAALPGAVAALGGLVAAGAAVAVVTSGSRALATTRLAHCGLPVPDVLVTVDDITHGKPDPEPFRLAVERLGVDPAECLAVEDTVPGLRSARAAGVGATLAVITSTAGPELAPYADLVVTNLAEVSLWVADGRVRVSRPSDP